MVITYDDFDSPGLTVMLTYHDDVSKILPSGKFKLENTIKTYRILDSLPQFYLRLIARKIIKLPHSVFRRWSDNKGMRDSQDKLLNQAEKIAENRIARQVVKSETVVHDETNVQIETSDIPSKTSSN